MTEILEKVFMCGLTIALIFMIIAFEGRGKEIREIEKTNKELEKVNVELQNKNNYLQFDGSEVQACPFCGSSEIKLHDAAFDKFYIECKGCYLTTGWCETVQDAIDAWNNIENKGETK